MPLEEKTNTMPPPPTDQTQAAVSYTVGSVEIDSSIWDGVSDQPEPLAKGVYHFCAKSYTQHDKGGQPYFTLRWVCQQEPDIGRSCLDNVSWVTDETIAMANDPNHPGHKTAVKLMKDRCWRAKMIMGKAGWLGSDFIAFLKTQPEVKIGLTVVPQKKKGDVVNGQQQYVDVPGKFGNKIDEYYSVI